MRDLEVVLYKGPRSNINMVIRQAYNGFYTMIIVKFAPFVSIYEIFTVGMCISSTMTFRMSQM